MVRKSLYRNLNVKEKTKKTLFFVMKSCCHMDSLFKHVLGFWCEALPSEGNVDGDEREQS